MESCENENSDDATEHREHKEQDPRQETSLVRLLLLVSAVSTTEICYAAEIAFATPLLLQIGLPDRYATLMWTLSPLLGLICQTPIGHASDNCTCSWGRRRPFILMFACISAIGLGLIPNGKILGLQLGDSDSDTHHTRAIVLTVVGLVLLDTCLDTMLSPLRAFLLDSIDTKDHDLGNNLFAMSAGILVSCWATQSVALNGHLGRGNHLL